MNIHNMKENISSLLARSVDRFNCIRKQLKHIKNVADKNNVSGCIDLVDDFVEISIKSEKEDFDRLIKSCEETENPENNLIYKYFLITIRDNDFYNSLSTLGDIFVKTFGYEFESNRFDFDKFKIYLPDLVCSIFSICQNEHQDYVRKYLKICYTPEEINKRTEESLKSKHNEAISVLPLLFSQNGFYTTVTDMSWANYSWFPDLTIYEQYPEIHTQPTIRYYTDEWLTLHPEAQT